MCGRLDDPTQHDAPREHRARPVGWVEGEYCYDCAVCGQSCMDDVYFGGWAHQVVERHEFTAFVYSDGSRHATLCVQCVSHPEDAVHQVTR